MFDILSITAGLKCALRFLTFLIKMRPAVFIVFCTLIKAPPEKLVHIPHRRQPFPRDNLLTRRLTNTNAIGKKFQAKL